MAEKLGFWLINPVKDWNSNQGRAAHRFILSVFPLSWILRHFISFSCCLCSSVVFPVLVPALRFCFASVFAVLCSLNLPVLPFSPHLSRQRCSRSLSPQLPRCSWLLLDPAPELLCSALTPAFHGADSQEHFHVAWSCLAFGKWILSFNPKDFSLKERASSPLSFPPVL